MTRTRHISFASVLLLCAAGLSAQETMPIDALRVGMRATAKTVFQADSVEQFEVEIIDILHNFYPKRSVIIVRLHGDKAEFAGPTSGMSGSPVYYEEKLIGALAYGFSNFPKDPIMGITPIDEMLEIFDKEELREGELAQADGGELMQRFVRVVHQLDPPDWRPFAPPREQAARMQALRKSPLPLQMSGFGPGVFEMAGTQLTAWGMAPQRSGSLGDNREGGELVPGAPIAAVLIGGDFDIAATGTVTYRKGSRILGFGHPFFDNGPVALPMAQARILATLSSSFSSSKMSSTGKIVGTLLQDRTTGVMGEIGVMPAVSDVRLKYTAENGDTSRYAFSVTRDHSVSSLAPLLLRLALLNGLEAARLSNGHNTLRVEGEVRLDSGETIRMENLYPGYQPTATFSFLNSTLHSTGDIASRMAALMNNPFKRVEIAGADLHFSSIPGRRSATLENVWVDQHDFKPGGTLNVTYAIRFHRGEMVLKSTQLKVPAALKYRNLTLVAAGARALNTYEERRVPGLYRATDYGRLLELVTNSRRNDRLYLQLRVADRGLVVEGDEMPGLPPSLYPVLSAQNGRVETARERDWAYVEIALPQDVMIEGIRLLQLRREP